MKQIITQHGWCLNSNMWRNLREEFKTDDLYWQDNERGYFHNIYKDSEWIEDNNFDIKMIISHSLGTRLIKRNILSRASHAVLINSFFNFIPANNRRNFIIRSLKKMEKKFNPKELKLLIKDFITRSFLPNELEVDFQELLKINNEDINSSLLYSDFKKLYDEDEDYNLFSKDCEILVIKSSNDLILEDNSIKHLIKVLNTIQNKTPKVEEIDGHGHIVKGSEIFNIIKKWLK